jgi:sensor histidine kinase YesM
MQKEEVIINPFNNPLIRFVSGAKYRWLRHALFILLGLVLAFKGDIGVSERFPSIQARDTVLMVDAVSFVFIMGMLYLLMMVVVPRLLFRSRILPFLLCFVTIIFLIYIVIYLLDHYYIQPLGIPGMQPIILSLLNLIQIGAVGAVLLGSVVGLKIFKKWITDVQHMSELQQNNLKAELEQLKSQVNPHFLFNTLNNLLVLMKTDADKAAQVLLGLSDLLRYQLYDSAKEKISLAKDIEFISNLLELEKLRKNDFDYTISTEGLQKDISLPPFLFIPFVENAIKHGASTLGHSYLTVAFTILDRQLVFSAENSKPLVKNRAIGGIGLKNIQRRLELLYPEIHSLQITDGTDKYSVRLTIPL